MHVFASAAVEAAYLADVLRRAHLLDGVPWSQMAVVVRTAVALGPLRRALSSAGVPVAVSADDLPLAGQPAVAPLLSALTALLPASGSGPEGDGAAVGLDEPAAEALLASPLGGATVLDLRRMRRAVRIALARQGIDAAERGAPLATALADDDLLDSLPEHVSRPARRVADVLAAGRLALAQDGTAEDVLWAMWQRSGLAAKWARSSAAGGPAGAVADRDLDAVVALFDAAAGFVDRLPSADVRAFVAHLSAQELPGDTGAARAAGGESVRLLTAHAAKGLEWDLVCVAGVQEGVWPDLRERTSLLGIEELVERASGIDGTGVDRRTLALAEERRLFYVACTRARRRLVVSAVEGALDGADAGANASRFLDLVAPPPEDGRPLTELPRSLTLSAARGRAPPRPDRPADPGRAPHGRRLGAPAPGRRGGPRRAPDRLVGPGAALRRRTAGARGRRRAGAPVGHRDLPALPAALGARRGRCRGVARTPPAPSARRCTTWPSRWPTGCPRPTRRPRWPPSSTSSTSGRAGPTSASASRRRRCSTSSCGGTRPTAASCSAPRRTSTSSSAGPGSRGQVDRLERDGEGRLVVVDLKTGKTTAKNTEEHGQLAAYQVAVSAGAFAEHGTVPGGAALLQVGTGAKAKEQHQEPLPADVPLDETWAGELVAQVGRGDGRGDVRGAHRLALLPLPDAPQLPAARARPAGDGMRPLFDDAQLSFDDLLADGPEEAPAPRRLLDPAEVAARCGLSYAPSAEQARVVAAPQDRPLVVVAGAGSGKTETMAARVSWLVANRLVEPEAILGLTFTRKAASELNERVRLRLGALARHPETEPELRDRLAVAQPTVATYHGYAAALVAEHGLRIGVEPGAGVLGPAMCWGQAATVVSAYTGDMDDVPLTLLTTVEDVLALATELGEHDISPQALRAWTARLEAQIAGYADAPQGPEGRAGAGQGDARPPAGPGGAAAAGRGVRGAQAGRRRHRLRRPGRLRGADRGLLGRGRPPGTGALAGRAARRVPGHQRRPAAHARGALRPRHRPSGARGRGSAAVHLRLARRLRRHHRALPPHLPRPARTAGRAAHARHELAQRRGRARRRQRRLGDAAAPGAAAARPRRGAHRRPGLGDRRALRHGGRGDRGPGRPARRLLDRHRRRRCRPGRTGAARRSRCWCGPASSCPASPPRCGSGASRWRSSAWAGCSRCPRCPTSSRRSPCSSTRPPATPSAGCSPVPAGGSGPATSPRWRPVPGRWSTRAARPGRPRTARRRSWRRRPSAAASSRRSTTSAAPTPTPPRVTAGCGGSVRNWRTCAAGSGSRCPTWWTRWPAPWAWRRSWPARRRSSPAGARAHLDALHAVAAEFTELAELPSLPAFLGYLRDAEERERGLEPGEVAVNPEAVQLLTGHSAKGLEWDVVAVPGMTKDQFPSKTDTSDSWVRDPGTVPAELRLTDREELPALRLPVPGSGDQAVVKEALDDYVQDWKDFGLGEEIRLGYVAVTRARHLLLCSGSWWRDGVKACGPSSLLTTVREACEAGRRRGRALGTGRPPDDATNPALEEWPIGIWPADPLSARTAAGAQRRGRAGRGGGAAPARARPGARRRRPAAGAVGARRRPAAARAGPARQPDGRRPAALAPVGVGAGRPCAATRPSWPAGCAARCRPRPRRRPGGAPRSTPGWRSGSARRAGRPRRAARVRRRVRRARQRARRPAGGVPRQRVGRPAAGRGRGAVRDPARARSRCAAGSTPSTPTPTAGSRSSTGRPVRRRRAPSSPPPACSWPPTGWAGRG